MPDAAANLRESSVRKLVEVQALYGEYLTKYLSEGRVLDKQKLEQDKLKIAAKLVNFIVSGAVLYFEKDAGEIVNPDDSRAEAPLDETLDETALFGLLQRSILLMLRQLNQPEVNLLKISLNSSFRTALQAIFTSGTQIDPDKFPVKVFRDVHPGGEVYIGINMRNTRSFGEDLNRIENDENLRTEIVSKARPNRHSDGNLPEMV